MGERGFADAGYILDQQMSTREQAGDTIAHLRRFANNDRVKLIQQRLKFFFDVHAINLTVKFFSHERDWLFHPQRLLEA